ncbi:MAG: FkbM family methyltransferase, partial [Candidatus Omnitrophica bacterium]|nr:FkbM family methyltransferase [Candidatus Omnitrophota bacterium]
IQGTKFEPEVAVLKNFVHPGDVCLDIGGAYGRYAFPLSKLVGSQGHIYSFEPGDYSHHVLSSVVWFHRLKNVTIIKKGLSNKTGAMKLLLPVKQSGKVGPSLAYIGETEKNDMDSQEIELTTIDTFFREKNLKRVDFIKCDTEGAEYLIFTGAKEVLSRFKPTVLSEVDKGNLQRFDLTTDDLKALFGGLGYKIYILEQGCLQETNNLDAERNYFFVHTEKQDQLSQ